MKKLVALLLAAILALSAATGAMAVTVNETGLPIVDEPLKLTIAALRHGNDASENFNEKYMIKKATEETGIEIDWVEFTDSSDERLSVMLAGDLPDVFLGLISDGQIIQNPELFIELTDEMISAYAPNVLATYESSVPGWKQFLTYPDGKIYGLMGSILSSYNDSIGGTMWVNSEWLDKAGKQVPATLDELKDVLAAFRDADMNGDGDASDEIPLNFCQSHYASTYWELLNMFGLPSDLDIVDGKVLPTMNTETLRTALETLHGMIDEGLINVEGLTQTAEQYNSSLASGKSGVFFGWAPYTYITDETARAAYVPMAPVTCGEQQPRRFSNGNIANRNCLVITKACEYPTAVLRWWDYLSRDQQTAYETRLGPLGLGFYLDEDGRFYTRTPSAEEAIAAGYEKYASNIGTSTWTASMGLTLCAPLMLYNLTANDPTSTSSIRKSGVDLWAPYFAEQTLPRAIIPGEAQEELDFATDGLSSYIDSFVAKALVDGVTDESWEAHLSALDSYGYGFYIEWNQKYLDGQL